MKLGSTRRWYRRFNWPLWASLTATLLCTLLFLGHRASIWTIPAIGDLEDSTSDTRFRLRGPQERLDNRVIIVALDDATRAGAPELWQTRRGLAALIDKITESEPKAIGVDAFFSSPEINLSYDTIDEVRSARGALSKEVGESKANGTPPSEASLVALGALSSVANETRGDRDFADSVARSPVLVLAGLFHLGGTPRPVGDPEPHGYSGGRFDEAVYLQQPAGKRAPSASVAISPIYDIAEVARLMGHVNVKHDADGAVREVPMVIEYAGRYYQSLSLKLASMELGQPTSYVAGDDFVTLGKRRIQLTSQTYAKVGYLGGNETFARISALELTEHKGPHPALKDRIVLVGYTDTVRDKIVTPFERQFDGVELHATLIHNILHDQIIRRGSPGETAAALILLGLILSLTQLRKVRKRFPWLLGVASFLCLGGYGVFTWYVFNRFNIQLDVVVPSASALLIVLTSLGVSLATEGREKAKIRSAFGQYLQSNLIEKILQDPERLKLGGQRRELTVLFSDIRSFSRFSEKLEPEVLSDFLNEYLTPMTDIVMDNSGMLDKYIGDAVMAVYGAPVPLDDHASRACRSALLMIESLVPMNKGWKENNLPEIRIGIGLNTGIMSVGNMGSQAHFDYTVMGDAVNLGSRLEGLTKTYGATILTGEATRQAASDDFVFREIDSVRVTGRTATARVFELCGTKASCPFSSDDLKLYQAGLDAYRAASWEEAISIFDRFLESHQDDGPAKTMRERVILLRHKKLDQQWDGVYTQSGK